MTIRSRRIADRLAADPNRTCWIVLGAALAVTAALILWLDRGTTYNVDQIRFFFAGPDLDLRGLFEPQNGNLVLSTTVAYKVFLGVFGADFLPFRIIHVVAVAVASTLFYTLVKRRVGPIAALAPTLVLLVFGSDWGHVGTALGFTVLSSIAAGLGALLLLEREDRAGDIGACLLLALSIANFSIGLGFAVGVAIWVLLGPDRMQRAWVFALPLLLYLAWWLWARGLDSPSQEPELASVLLFPGYAFTSLSAVLASLSGLNYDFSHQAPPEIALGPGPALAAGALVLMGIRLTRGNVPRSVWVGLGIVFTFWLLGSLVFSPEGSREPTKTRYMYPGAVMVLLVATAALIGSRPTRRALLATFAVAAFAISTNLVLLRNGSAWLRNEFSPKARAQFAMLDLARDQVEPNYDPRLFVKGSVVSTPAEEYLRASERFGSPGFSAAELASQPDEVRALADRVLAGAVKLGLDPARPPGVAARRCEQRSGAGGPISIQLPPGTAVALRPRALAAASAGRFSDGEPVDLGLVVPGPEAWLTVPDDDSATPWRLAIATPLALRLCSETDP